LAPAYAALQAAAHGITLLVEAINPTDIPGYLIGTQDNRAMSADHSTRERPDQLDLYHVQMTEGNLARHHAYQERMPMCRWRVCGRNEPISGG